jgi:hypothetical protein
VALGYIEGARGLPIEFEGVHWTEEDLTLMALLTDPIYLAELLWEDPENHEYGGCYKVRDYQYPLFRANGSYEIFACGRSVGKTESIKARAQSFVFKRIGQNLLLTAPELIHLKPLTDAIEDNFRASRLTRELLDTRGQKTGFTHRPFGIDLIDGTKIVGRIPQKMGTGVKGQHQPDLIMDEGQDYPERGYAEIAETVMKDTVDKEGNPDFHYHIYGVHSGNKGGGFYKNANGKAFRLTNITALMRPDWPGPDGAQKNFAKGQYGGTASPDYRRNILGEAGGASSPYFVLARLMACVDQGKDGDPDSSVYNTQEYQAAEYRVEEIDEQGLPLSEVFDLPDGYKEVYAGMDVGLNDSPTVITIWSHQRVGKVMRLKLIRRIHLVRFRSHQVREAVYAIAWHFGAALKGFGVDQTGLGNAIVQEMQDDQGDGKLIPPPFLNDILRGWFFNQKIAVGVSKEYVVNDNGRLKDQFGSSVKIETDVLTGVTRYITEQPMIEASTRHLREFVDSGFLMLPFDTEITEDMTRETPQRLKAVTGLRKKPNAYHILDSMRAMAMSFKIGEIDEALADDPVQPVMDHAVDMGGDVHGGLELTGGEDDW